VKAAASATSTTATDVAGDGRVARRDRNRDAVLDAMLDLFSEDDLDPDLDAVALRSGVSARSVYRYFEDREGLVRAAIERHLEHSIPLFLVKPLGEGSLGDRIERIVGARLRLHESIGATARAGRVRATFDPIVREQLDITRRAMREQVEHHFAPELQQLATRPRRFLSTAIDVLLQLESLDYYRLHRGFTLVSTRDQLVDTLHSLLEP
jgi:AcrR family transcriptional regulator